MNSNASSGGARDGETGGVPLIAGSKQLARLPDVFENPLQASDVGDKGDDAHRASAPGAIEIVVAGEPPEHSVAGLVLHGLDVRGLEKRGLVKTRLPGGRVREDTVWDDAVEMDVGV